MATNLLISGGPLHDFARSSAVVSDVLAEVDVTSTVVEDPQAALDLLVAGPGTWDMVTVNGLHWQMPGARHAHLRDRWSFTLGEDQSLALEQHVLGGGGLLACHAAVICFDADPRWGACIGATWNWDRSSHPPSGPATVAVTPAGRRHPLTAGIDDFETVDEVYGFLDEGPDLVPLLASSHGGVEHPLLWAREVGRGRVVTDLLGHDAAAMGQPDHREILRRAGRWLAPTVGGSNRPEAPEWRNATP